MNSLAALYGNGALIPASEQTYLMNAARSIRLDADRTTARWQEWYRPAGAHKQKISFGGLLGDLCYKGAMEPFIPWLALGQWTGIGGKTGFGLGLYELRSLED